MALYSVRLKDETEEALARIARSRKVTRAVILREAIAEYTVRNSHADSLRNRLSPLIGVIENGPGTLSEQTGRSFATLLFEGSSSKDAAARQQSTQRHPTKRQTAKRRTK